MNPPKELNPGSITILYKKYKMYTVPAVIIFVCITIFLFVILPQMQQITSLKQSRVALETQVAQLKRNIQTLQTIDGSTVSKQLDVSTSALPSEKDFFGVLNAIGTAAQNAQVLIADYNLNVGSLSASSGKSSELALQMNVTLNGGPSEMQRFLRELYKEVPLSEAQSVQISGEQSTATINFFYNPFPDLSFDPQVPIRPIAADQNQMLAMLAQWRDTTNTPVEAIIQPTPTIQPTISPTLPVPTSVSSNLDASSSALPQ